MGTTVECLLDVEASPAAHAALRAIEIEFERLEAVFSRFRPDSELSELNRNGALVVGADLLRVTELALAARERTGGRFDPTIHEALVAAGYDRTFTAMELDGVAANGGPLQRCGGGVTIDHRLSIVELEPGVRVDLGGIAKGYAVDRACEILAGIGPCLVNAGGDLAVQGIRHQGSWHVGVDTAHGMITLGLDHGAIATSGRDQRRWQRSGEGRHHLIDPATRRPSTSNLLRVTVVASQAVEAEILAKALLLAGEEEAVSEANELRLPCLFVTEDGRDVWAGGLG